MDTTYSLRLRFKNIDNSAKNGVYQFNLKCSDQYGDVFINENYRLTQDDKNIDGLISLSYKSNYDKLEKVFFNDYGNCLVSEITSLNAQDGLE